MHPCHQRQKFVFIIIIALLTFKTAVTDPILLLWKEQMGKKLYFGVYAGHKFLISETLIVIKFPGVNLTERPIYKCYNLQE